MSLIKTITDTNTTEQVILATQRFNMAKQFDNITSTRNNELFNNLIKYEDNCSITHDVRNYITTMNNSIMCLSNLGLSNDEIETISSEFANASNTKDRDSVVNKNINIIEIKMALDAANTQIALLQQALNNKH